MKGGLASTARVLCHTPHLVLQWLANRTVGHSQFAFPVSNEQKQCVVIGVWDLSEGVL